MTNLLETVVLSLLAYDEDINSFQKKVRKFFPDAKFHFRKDTTTDLFGVVEINKIYYIWIRGTGDLIPWFRNINFLSGKDGSHNGFECSANSIWHHLGETIKTNGDYKFKIVGHSAATGITPILQTIVTKKTGRAIDGYGFGVVPPGNRVFKEEYIKSRNNYQSWSSYGDPFSIRFRRKGTMLFDGCDVGVKNTLPKIKFWECWRGFRTLSHSPRRMCDRLWRHDDFKDLYDELMLLKQLCVN